MGQYYLYANYDKKEYISTFDLDRASDEVFSGMMKMFEQCHNSIWVLGYLLWRSTEAGGGDYCDDNGCNDDSLEHMGRWAGDKIAMVGDYSNLSQERREELCSQGYIDMHEKQVYNGKREWKYITEWNFIIGNFTEISNVIGQEVKKFGEWLGH